MTKKKTIREWFEQCDKPWAKEALENGLNEESQDFVTLNTRQKRLSDAIGAGFIWWRTPQGQAYWYGIYKDLQSKNQ